MKIYKSIAFILARKNSKRFKSKNTKKLGWTIKQKNEKALPALILECDYKP